MLLVSRPARISDHRTHVIKLLTAEIMRYLINFLFTIFFANLIQFFSNIDVQKTQSKGFPARVATPGVPEKPR